MPTCEIRPFRRSDRAQLTDLVAEARRRGFTTADLARWIEEES